MSTPTQPPRTAVAIRRAFLDFFIERHHREVPSYAVIPPDDPTLYFVNAGMVQFKDVFVGARQVDYQTATSCQKCLRVSGKHNDLENVGRTRRHHTLFEMLGNFSFGDYFKQGAIEHAWTFLTEVMALPPDLLHVSVHPDDQEARELWQEIAGLPPERVHDDEENFWSMGDTGPCGPCSEIHLDQGAQLSGGEELPFGHPEAEERYLEIWNLVFMQFDRSADGELTPLPRPSIDTGMGLERLVAIMQGKLSNFETDLFLPLIERVAQRAGVTYGNDEETDVALRVIADHSRATAILIGDGVYPDNEGRGYVLRRIMRRGIRFGRLLGLQDPFLVETTAQVIDELGDVYPELVAGRETIHSIVLREEERFGKTIQTGMKRLADELGRLEGGGDVLPGKVAFELYDTYGFPLDLTELICAERRVMIDHPGFQVSMEEQRARARAASRFGSGDTGAYQALSDDGMRSAFVGYDQEEITAEVLALLVDGEAVADATAGQTVEVVCDATPFYAESGGQVGDQGSIRGPGGALVVSDTQRPFGELIVHRGELGEGKLSVGDSVELQVDHSKREATRRNHSATHLLHDALRHELGEHVRQRGSWVGPERLRFDFSHMGAMTPEEILRVEELVNAEVLENTPVETEILTMDQAMDKGAIAFFEEKYEDDVRVLTVGSSSVELCGGTHARATGDIGLFKIISESAISSGIRRLEAVTGAGAARWVQQRDAILKKTAEKLHVSPDQVFDRVQKLLDERKVLVQELETAKKQARLVAAASAVDDARQVGKHRLAAIRLDGISGKELRPLGESLRDRVGSGAVLVISVDEGKVSLVVAVTADLSARLPAGKMVGGLASLVGGRGGGRPDLAQAGGTDASGVDAVIEAFYSEAAQALET